MGEFSPEFIGDSYPMFEDIKEFQLLGPSQDYGLLI